MKDVDRRTAMALGAAASAMGLRLSVERANAASASPVGPPPAVAAPTVKELHTVARELGLKIADADAKSYIELMQQFIGAYNALAGMPDGVPALRYPRSNAYRPQEQDNKFNAWYVKVRVEGASEGKLKGKTLALKDNIMLAGVPMMNGSSTLEGYVPEIDATIVTRILDAGGTILGKAHCEQFCASGGSHTNSTGPVHNPYRYGYTTGGSSSGSAALVAAKEVDMAIGGDQGGSIRIPSSYCGLYGMKPTHGLVPYTGIMPVEPTIDHAGPMTANVRDNALLLEVLAGADGIDPRQYAPKVEPYVQKMAGGVKGIRIGVVKEGFGQPNSEAAVDEKVRAAAMTFGKLGAIVQDISVPLHAAGLLALVPIFAEGGLETMMLGDGFGVSRSDLYVTSLMDHHRNWRKRANELSDNLKLTMMMARHIRKTYGGRYYGKAINFARVLRAAYDTAFTEVDLLLMPTAPTKARPIPPKNASRAERVIPTSDSIANTGPFDATHHPAMSIPCGMIDGLPVGLMLVAKHFDEATIYRAALAFEHAGDWKLM